jgi:hypothetical protein
VIGVGPAAGSAADLQVPSLEHLADDAFDRLLA